MSLSVNNLVNVTVNLSPTGAAVRSFGTLMIAGDSDVINGQQRFRTYTGIDAVATDFGVDAPEYKAAVLYFGQSPKPFTLLIGRWFSTADAGENDGGILTAAEAAIAQWTTISNGSFTIVVDGVSYDVTGLDFTGETNLNGVASVITAGLTSAGSDAVCTWNGSYFIITSGSTGAGAQAAGTITLDTNPSYGVQASGTITLSGQPSNGDTVTIKGTVVTFVTGTPSGNQVQIAGTALLTAAALQTFLAASADANLAANTYNTIALITTITARVYGTAGNSYGLLKSGVNIAVSGATLSGGVAPDTLTVNGTAITFVKANPTGSQVLVGPTVGATAGNLQAFLAASTNVNIDNATYSLATTVITVTAVLAGTAGNSFTLAKSSSHITLSGAVLSGGAEPSEVGYATAEGAGTDISAQTKLDEDNSQALVTGYDAETPVECVTVLANLSPNWYGLMFASTVAITDDQNVNVAAFIEAQSLTRVFGVTIQNTNVLSALVSNDLASRLKALGYNQSCSQYSSSSPYAIASFMGRAFSVDFTQQNTTITLMFKQEPGVSAEELSESEALTLKGKNCNVFVAYVNDTMILQYGNMASGQFFDTIQNVDWLQNAIQTNVYNVLYTTLTKIPQTDAGVNQITTAISQACSQGVNNGMIAPGTWNGPSFGQITTGQFLKAGFYVFAQSVALQSQADRAARICPPIQVAVKLAGAIQSVNIIVNVNA